jgi:hypothetical protein
LAPRQQFTQKHGGERRRGERAEAGERAGDHFGHFRRFDFHVRAEECLAYDQQRQLLQLQGDVDFEPVLPTLAPPRRPRCHQVAIARDVPAVKRRQDEPALAVVVFSLARQKTLTEEEFRAPHRIALLEAVLPGDENVFDVVGVAEQKEAESLRAEIGNVAAVGGHPSKEVGRVAA